MSKLAFVQVMVIAAVGGLSHSAAWASWSGDCHSIQSGGSGSDACSAIQQRVDDLKQYAPVRPFYSTSADGTGMESKVPWQGLSWASSSSGGQGGGSGGQYVLPGDTEGDTTNSTTDAGFQ